MDLLNGVHGKSGLEQAEHFPFNCFLVFSPFSVGTWTKRLICFDENKI